MRRPWPGDIVWYRMWVIGLLAAAGLLFFVGWFAAVALAMCVMGAYGVLLPFVYDGDWTRDAEGDSVWSPKESISRELSEPPRDPEEGKNSLRSTFNSLFSIAVVGLLAFLVIDTLVAK